MMFSYCFRNFFNNKFVLFRTATARGKAEQADISAMHAQEDSNIARLIAKQFDPDAKMPGMVIVY